MAGKEPVWPWLKFYLTDNDILFLDEPTNYLDLSAIEWLEEFLANYQGAVLLISHDRYFLDHVVNGIYEIEFCKLKRYRGNYTFYRRAKGCRYASFVESLSGTRERTFPFGEICTGIPGD